jgi:hypothetical protein
MQELRRIQYLADGIATRIGKAGATIAHPGRQFQRPARSGLRTYQHGMKAPGIAAAHPQCFRWLTHPHGLVAKRSQEFLVQQQTAPRPAA